MVLRDGERATEDEIIAHVRGRLASYKAPRQIEFATLPKTSTGKIQKYVLRQRERSRADGPAAGPGPAMTVGGDQAGGG